LSKLFSRAEIRKELINVRRELLSCKHYHLQAFGVEHGSKGLYGSLNGCGRCHVCDGFDEKINGINWAIRHFGGKPRYS
jgi:hypothetical protein